MIERPLDLLHNSSLHCKLQKDAFRDAIQSYAEGLGYSVSAEKIPFGGTNLVFGDSKNAKYLVTSCYDLSCVATLLEIAGSVPQIHRNRVCFVLFDQKIFGLFGSGFYAKFHKAETKNQIVLHLASVGFGDHIRFFPTEKLKKDRRKLNPIYTCCGQFGNKFITIQEKRLLGWPSCHNHFSYGVSIYASKKRKSGLQLFRRTKTHPISEQTNVNILRAAICTLISCDAMQ